MASRAEIPLGVGRRAMGDRIRRRGGGEARAISIISLAGPVGSFGHAAGRMRSRLPHRRRVVASGQPKTGQERMIGATAGPRQPVRMTAWAACLALLLAAVPAGVAEARTFRAADIQAEDYPTVQALMHLDKLLQERTNGRHRLQIFHSRQLGEEKETIEQTRAGAIDLNRINVAPIASFAPEANVLVLPFLFRSVDHLHRVLDGAIGNDILKSFDASGFVGLTFYDSGARSIYNSV